MGHYSFWIRLHGSDEKTWETDLVGTIDVIANDRHEAKRAIKRSVPESTYREVEYRGEVETEDRIKMPRRHRNV